MFFGVLAIVFFIDPNIQGGGCNMPEKVKRTLSQSVRGSMTVEASIVLPLFLIFFINLSSSIEMIRLSGKLDTALWSIGSDLSYYGAFLTNPVKEMGATGHIKKREEEHKEEDESPGEEKSGNDKENETGKEILRKMGDIVL